MKKNPIQKKGIWLMSIGLLFIVLTVVLSLWQGIEDPGSMTLGVMFLTMGAMQYFIRGKQYQMPDEMIKKINALAMAQSFWYFLMIGAAAYLVHTWWWPFPITLDTLFQIVVFGNLILFVVFQWRYRTHTEKLPF